MWIKLIPLSKSCCLPSTEPSFTADTEIISEFQPPRNGWNFNYCKTSKGSHTLSFHKFLSLFVCFLSNRPRKSLCVYSGRSDSGVSCWLNATGALLLRIANSKTRKRNGARFQVSLDTINKKSWLLFEFNHALLILHTSEGAVSAEGQTPVIVREDVEDSPALTF